MGKTGKSPGLTKGGAVNVTRARGPYDRGTQTNRRNLLLFLCSVGLGVLPVSTASGQVLDGTILLPDSLGPLTGKTHVAFDESPGHPRMFIGSEDGNVLVMSTLTGERLARMQSGPVKSICFSPARNKLYISLMNEYAVVVLDCSTYQTITKLQLGSLVTGLVYNPLVDRVYCATWCMPVIDCATDSIVDSLPVYARNATFDLDTLHNKLYVGAADTFRVIDCNRDSVVASIPDLRKTLAVCFQPTAARVYVGNQDGLFAIDTKSDTLAYWQKLDSVNLLACDPERNRVYFTVWCYGYYQVYALDCSRDSIIWWRNLTGRPIAMAAVPEYDKLYVLQYGHTHILDGSTGQTLRQFYPESDSALGYSSAAKRVFLTWNGHEVTAIDCRTDTVVGVTPLAPHITDVCLDSVNNKLYFSVGKSGVGVVDCSTGKVKSYARVDGSLRSLKLDSRDGKLYCSGDSSIFVLDCGTDTFVKEIPIHGWALNMEWHPTLNKLYALSGKISSSDTEKLLVIDCTADTISKALDSVWPYCSTLLSPELNQLWLVAGGYKVFDCLRDSFLADTWVQLNCKAASYDPSNHQVYAVSDYAMHVIDMDTRLPVDSLPIPHSANAGTRQVYCAPLARKAYWTIMHGLPYDPDTVIVVDTRIDSIVSRFAVPFLSWGQCEDRTGDHVYFASEYLVAADARTDSVVSGVRVPLITRFLVRNSRTNRLYLAGLADSVIQVVYDSVVFAGLQAAPESPPRAARLQTVLSRSAPLRSPTEAVLFDASGRRAAVLKSGPNDISHLAPGVYFVRQALSVRRDASSVTKVVVTR